MSSPGTLFTPFIAIVVTLIYYRLSAAHASQVPPPGYPSAGGYPPPGAYPPSGAYPPPADSPARGDYPPPTG